MTRLFAGALSALALVATAAHAAQGPDNYPTRPVRVIVPVAAAGGTDIIARIVMTKLADATGGNFIIDNRPGAGGLLGNEIVAKAPRDGQTLLFTYAAHTIVPFIYQGTKIPYDVYKDFAPITLVGQQPLLLALSSKVPADSVAELIKLARDKPGSLNVAWATPSSSGALAAEIFKLITKTDMTSVPFRGGALALTALIQNEVQLIFTTPPTVMPHLKSGRVKVVATSGKTRVPYLPDVPTLAESGVKDFNTAPWQGLLAPAGTSREIIAYLHNHIAAIMKMPDVRERFASQGTDPVALGPKEFGDMINRELALNSKVIKAVGMRAD
ncbi:MAG TPA: tripartite tricarboxylate transporter substrate binding protein [Burkholderiales bacterium]|nr:tripartite tricarboxylate transporter substrate binding protein [Burkholderiales bacterium]